MKKINALIFIGLMVLVASCKKYFDVNTNPNDATSATPELILPQAITTSAGNLNAFNTYGAQLAGYMANAGGYGGFGVSFTYNFTSSNWNNLWAGVYDNLEDYQTILNRTAGLPTYSYFNAAARIMKVLGFQLLVDAYNDVPYFEALQGANKLSPAYTDAKTIYKDLASQLDTAINTITAGAATVAVKPLGSSDVLFKGDVNLWKKLANTLKLRLLIHAGGKVGFENTTFSNDGFLTTDALINPGYVRDNNKQNPKWDAWTWSYSGSARGKAWMPATFIMAFYNGVKLSDAGRGAAVYYQFPSTPTNTLGYENTSVASSPEGSFWYPGTNRSGTSAGDTTGTIKGPNAGIPLMTAAESYFLQAEAVVKGILPGGDAETLFKNGITASFKYLYAKPDGTITGTPEADAATYISQNNTSYLADFSIANTTDQKIEAIITQKYIALNMVNSDEAWNEYRRTHYPALVNTAGATGTQTFASTGSESTRPDRLPTRILYPASEGAYNSSNLPKNITPFSSIIFWAQ
jgi:hypothetical protein